MAAAALVDPAYVDTSDEDDVDPVECAYAPPSLEAQAEVQRALLAAPGKLFLELLKVADPRACEWQALHWIREQKRSGRLGAVTKEEEVPCCCWIQATRWQRLKELLAELESLRTYRATAEDDIHRAISCINAASSASMRFSHH